METILKTCTCCGIPKELSEYHKSKDSKYGVKPVCKVCKKDLRKTDYEDKRETYLANKQQFYINNKETIVDRVMTYRKDRLATDPHFRAIQNTRNLIRNAFKRKFTKKSAKTLEILGCSFEEFRAHIEAKFDEHMNWDNFGSYWVLDHIMPIAGAKTTDDIVRLNHYTNFQPLEKIENIRKGAK